MNYIVFDLEFNQGFKFGREKKAFINPACPFEIIHIGAIKLDENLNTIGKFDSLVRSKIYTRLHPYVKKMTGISKEDLKGSKSFKSVFNEFVNFMGSDSVLCLWGNSDIRELLKNIEYHKLDASAVPDKYIDVQHYASKYFHQPKNASLGLRNAVKLLNIPEIFDYHNAFNDAYYTAEVLKRIYNDDIKPQSYSKDKNHSVSSWKSNLDVDKLVNFIENSFGREVTEDEKRIIKLSYKMGYLKQFQKSTKPPED